MIRKVLLAAVAPFALVASAMSHAPAYAQRTAVAASERQEAAQQHPALTAEFGGAYQGKQFTYVTQVAQRIAAPAGLSASTLNTTLLNSPVDNAFAVPGGYVYITRQLVALMNDEAELAAVMGHEVAHVAARHGQKRQNVSRRNSILGALGQAVVGAVTGNSTVGRYIGQGIGSGSQLATLGYSRGQETQSDDLAIRYLASVGYDPAAMASALRSLSAQETLNARLAGRDARSVPAWASTHPASGARVQRATQQAAASRGGGARNRDAFLAAIDGMLYGEDPRQGIIEGRDFLHPDMRIAFTIPQGFSMQNGANAVTISGQSAQAQLSTAAYNGNLEAYVGSVVRGLAGNAPASPANVQRTSVNGVPAAYTTFRAASGNTQVDATVFAYAPATNRAYHFVILTPAGSGIGALQPMVQSFRTLSAQQAAAIRPRYLRVVTVGPRDTLASVSGRMAWPTGRLERFMVLNGLGSTARLQPGQKVKIVTY